MKISIDTSSFSFKFLGVWLGVIFIVVFMFFSKGLGFIGLLVAVTLIVQKYKYLIPDRAARVSGQVEKTLQSLGLNYQKTPSGFSTKTVKIKVTDLGLFSILRFRFDRVYTVQGEYLTEAVVKYQRYT